MGGERRRGTGRYDAVMARSKPLDDPLLEFIARGVARALATERGLDGGNPATNAIGGIGDDRSGICPVLDRQAGPVIH